MSHVHSEARRRGANKRSVLVRHSALTVAVQVKAGIVIRGTASIAPVPRSAPRASGSTDRSHRARIAHFVERPGVHVVDEPAHGDDPSLSSTTSCRQVPLHAFWSTFHVRAYRLVFAEYDSPPASVAEPGPVMPMARSRLRSGRCNCSGAIRGCCRNCPRCICCVEIASALRRSTMS